MSVLPEKPKNILPSNIVYRNKVNYFVLNLEIEDILNIKNFRVFLKQQYTKAILNSGFYPDNNNVAVTIRPIDLISFNLSLATIYCEAEYKNGTKIKSNLLPILILPQEYNSDFKIEYEE